MDPITLGLITSLLGAGIGGIGSLFGSSGKERQFQNFTPEQQAALDQLLKQGLLDSNFSGIENLARQNFQSQTIPSIAERFTAMGGGQRSSAFQGALGSAGSALESQLGALRNQAGLQKLQLGLTPRFQTAYTPRQPGLEQLIAPSLGAATQFGQAYMGQQQNNQLESLLRGLSANKSMNALGGV